MSTDVDTSTHDTSTQDPATRYRRVRDAHAEVTDVPDAGLDRPRIPLPREPFPFPPLKVRRSGVYRAPGIVPPFPHVPTPIPLPNPLPIPPIDLPTRPHGANGHATHGTTDGVEVTGLEDDAAAIVPGPPIITPLFGTDELRVDVDGVKPTMTMSGTVTRLRGGRLTWIARVTRDASGAWVGPISYRDGNTALRPQTRVSVQLTGGPFLPTTRTAVATFSGGGSPTVSLTYYFRTAEFREIALEYDTVSDATAVTTHNPSSHPNHAPSAPTTTLSIESAYSRLGLKVTKTGGDSAIPAPAGTWSDQEMHDAMQAHWSRWADAPQWAMWVLFARQHDMGSGLGGIMFDDIGTAQRQGTAIFNDSFISQAPAGEANPGAWVERMRFWTAMHEIGHGFNLAHSWQKSLGTQWMPLTNEPDALSYMNYPYNYPGGLDAFFASFDYSFSPNELLFLRHAPERLVKMGAAPWFEEHGFEQDAYEHLRAATTGALELELRVHREPRFEFLEPVVVELRLKNVATTPVVVDAHALQGDGLSVVVAREGGEAKQWRPFATYCAAPEPKVLQPGEATYTSLFVSAGAGGWLVSDPGTYTLYAATEAVPGNGTLSRPLRIVVGRPTSDASERLADDVFTQDVAHVLAFGGSRVLESANDTLREVAAQLPESRAAVHANAALGAPMAADGKVLVVDDSGREAVEVVPAEPEEAQQLLSASLDHFDRAADALGHITVTEQTLRLASVLEESGDTSGSSDLLHESADALERRGVLPGVVQELRSR